MENISRVLVFFNPFRYMIFFVFLVSLLGSYSLMPTDVRDLLLERSPKFWLGITLVDLCALVCGLGVALLFYKDYNFFEKLALISLMYFSISFSLRQKNHPSIS